MHLILVCVKCEDRVIAVSQSKPRAKPTKEHQQAVDEKVERQGPLDPRVVIMKRLPVTVTTSTPAIVKLAISTAIHPIQAEIKLVHRDQQLQQYAFLTLADEHQIQQLMLSEPIKVQVENKTSKVILQRVVERAPPAKPPAAAPAVVSAPRPTPVGAQPPQKLAFKPRTLAPTAALKKKVPVASAPQTSAGAEPAASSQPAGQMSNADFAALFNK